MKASTHDIQRREHYLARATKIRERNGHLTWANHRLVAFDLVEAKSEILETKIGDLFQVLLSISCLSSWQNAPLLVKHLGTPLSVNPLPQA